MTTGPDTHEGVDIDQQHQRPGRSSHGRSPFRLSTCCAVLAALVFTLLQNPSIAQADPSPAQPSAWTTTLTMTAGALSTVAGDGTAAVQDGAGTGAKLNTPNGMSIAGSSGYFYDSGYMRKVALSTGVVTTVAGDGSGGCADSSTPSAAKIGFLSGNLVNDGNFLYWFDGTCGLGSGAGILRKLSLNTGEVSYVPGSVYGRYLTVGPDGSVYGTVSGSVFKVNTSSGATTTLATPTQVMNGNTYTGDIRGIAADGSFVWVTGTYNCDPNAGCLRDAISKISLTTGTATSITISDPRSFALNGALVSAGDYLYDAAGSQILRYTKSDGSLTTVAGATGYGFIEATGADGWLTTALGLDSDGTKLWISDVDNHRIRKVVPAPPLASAQPAGWTTANVMAAGAVSTIAGDGSAAVQDGTGTGAKLNAPKGMTIANGYGYFYDSGYFRKVSLSTGAVTTVSGDGSGVCANSDVSSTTKLGEPWGWGNVVNDGSFLYWFDLACGIGSGAGVLRRMSLTTGAASYVPGKVYGSYLAIGPSGNLFVVGPNGHVSKVNLSSGELTEVAAPAQVVNGTTYEGKIKGITADSTSIWVTVDYGCSNCGYLSNSVTRIDIQNGNTSDIYVADPRTTGLGVNGPVVSAGKYLYFGVGAQVLRLAKAGGALTSIAGSNSSGYADGYGAGAQFGYIYGIDSDSSGLWISDVINHLIRRVVAAPPGAPTISYPTAGVNPAEMPGSGNASQACACSQGQATNYPVNTNSGAFWHTFSDLATPGRGPALEVTRSYVSSTATTDSAFGYGWSFNYGLNLTKDAANGNVTVHQEDGSQVAFQPSTPAGSFTPMQPRILASLKENSNGSYTFTRRNRITFTFGPAGLLRSIADLNGNATTLAYDADNYLSTATDAAGRVYTFTVNGDGHITKVVAPGGRSYIYGYSGAGNLVSATDPTGAVWTHTYDGQHRMLTMLNPNQQNAATPTPLTNVYDSSGRVTQQTDFAGRTTSLDYTAISGATKVTDPVGNVSVDYYSNGLRTKSTIAFGSPRAASTTYTYDPTTLATSSVTDPLNHTTSFTYDARGNVLTSTDALNHTTTNTYSAQNNLLTTTDPLGTTSSNTYDSAGNMTSTAVPLKSGGGSVIATLTTTYQHADASHPDDVTGVVDPKGNTTKFAYDSFGNLTSVTAPPTPENAAGNRTTYSYDTNTGWRLTETRPRGNLAGATVSDFTTSYAYDSNGRLTRVRDSLWSSSAPTLHQTSVTYDADGNQLTGTDKMGRTTSAGYNKVGEQISTTLPDSTSSSQTWTANGQLKTSTDPAGRTTTYTYDERGSLATSTDPLNRTTNLTYDAAGNLTLRATPGATCTGSSPTSGCTSYTYNAVNQLTSRTYLNGGPGAVTGITYDANGRPTQRTDASGTQISTYDNIGRLLTYKDGAGTTVTYGYDANGNNTSIAYPGANHTVTRAFDALNRMSSVTDWNAKTIAFGYDPNSNPTTTTFPAASGETNVTTYDKLDDITGIGVNYTSGGTTSTLAGFAYTRDANGMLATATTTGITDAAQTYTRDTRNRLTASGASSTPTTYGYSANDNITNRGSLSSGTRSTQTFDDAGQLCWTKAATVANATCGSPPSGNITYSYDVNGNRIQRVSTGTTTYAYNQEQQLTSYTPGAGGAATTYTYDGDGLRQSKSGNVTSTFTWAHVGAKPLLLADSSNYYIYDNTGSPVQQITVTGGTTRYLHRDQLGSIRLITSASGSVTGSLNYDPYGKQSGATGTFPSPFGFAGEYTDSESGQVYLRARYYDPGTGQFITRDPMVAFTGQPYAYAGNAPLDATDPLGLWPDIESVLTAINSVNPMAPMVDGFIAEYQAYDAGCSFLTAFGIGLHGTLQTAFELGTLGIGGSVSLGGRAALREGGEETVQLFRHVDLDELADLIKTETFNLGPNSTGKYFAETADDAVKWGAWLNEGQGGMVSTTVPASWADKLMRWDKLDNIGPARFASPEQLAELNAFMNGVRFH